MSRPTAAVLLTLIVALGAWLRVWNAGTQPFWRDEACVAGAVRGHSYAELARQTELPMPPLFALVVKAAGQAPGAAEWTLRLPSLLAGSLLPLVAYWVARVLRAPRGMALCAAAVTATSAASVIWARELKHYSIEALLAALGALLVFSLVANRRLRPLIVVGLLVLALAAPWLGYGAVFALVTLLLGGSLLPGGRGRSAGRGVRVVCSVALLALGVSAALAFVMVAGPQSDNEALRNFMRPWLLEAGNPSSWARIAFYLSATTATLVLSLNWLAAGAEGAALTLIAAVVLAGVMAIGVWHWPRGGRRWLVWWLVAPLVAMLAAAALGKYPFGQVRMMQVWTPAALVALGAGAYGLARMAVRLLGGPRSGAVIVGLALSLKPAAVTVGETLHHRHFVLHEFPRLLERLKQERTPGELVLCDAMSAACVRYYAAGLDQPVEMPALTSGTMPPPGSDFCRDAGERARLARGRVWWLTTDEGVNVTGRAALEARLRGLGYRVRSIMKGAGSGTLGGAAELLVAER